MSLQGVGLIPVAGSVASGIKIVYEIVEPILLHLMEKSVPY